MITLKSIIFIVMSLTTVAVFVKNYKKWTTRYRSYMIENSKKMFGTGMVWEKPFGKFIVAFMYVWALILIVLCIMGIVFTEY